MKTYIEFGGFYGSNHEGVIDGATNDEYFENINYKKTHEAYGEKWLDELNNELGTKIKYLGVWSPREYNFETDEIHVDITKKCLNEIIRDHCDQEELEEFINEESRSRDGFASFCSGYNSVRKDDDLFGRYVFRFLLREMEIEPDFSSEDVVFYDDVRMSGAIRWCENFTRDAAFFIHDDEVNLDSDGQDLLIGEYRVEWDEDESDYENVKRSVDIMHKLDALRASLRDENISYGELHELQNMVQHIAPDDVELLEAAGVPEKID